MLKRQLHHLFILVLIFLFVSCQREQDTRLLSIKFNYSTYSLQKGETFRLIAETDPRDYKTEVTWTSSNKNIASVDKGVVKGLTSGDAIITAYAEGKTAKCKVTVTSVVTAVYLNKPTLTMEKGSSETLIATIEPSDASDKSVTWSSSDDNVASVDDYGLVKALKGGECFITAKAGDKTASCSVTVTSEVTSIVLNKTSLTIAKGASEVLVATIEPADATDKSIIWSSSNDDVASVDDNGLVKALKGGECVITAKAGEKTASCSVTVTSEVTSIVLNKTSLTIAKGSSEALIATVEPFDASDKSVTWSSSDSNVAAVDENGLVKALKGGECVITAKAGDKMASCSVTVTSAVTSIVLNKTELTITKGSSEKLVATIEPSDATDKSIIWSSSDDGVASVDGDGLVKALKGGDCVITAKAGDKLASCAVMVTAEVTSIVLNKTTLTIEKGSSETLIATVEPSDASDKSVTWSSSDSNVASVDDNGLVKALKGGDCVITAKAGDKTATCKVNVTSVVTSITLNKTVISLSKGASEQLIASIEPSDATDKSVIWSTSNGNVASVDNSGLVKALMGGECVITAKAGDKTATCTVSVSSAVTSISLDKTELSMLKGATVQLIARIEPSDASDKSVTWSSSDSRVASVDNNGLVEAFKGGECVITAKTGDKAATCKVTVVSDVTSIKLNKTTLTLSKGTTEQLVASIEPSDATDQNITWSSSDVSVASVDNNGLVKALKGGKCVIKATAGGKMASCSITVISEVTSIVLDRTSLLMGKGDIYVLTATVEPYDASDKNVTWSSSDDSVASVNLAGIVEALKCGECTITAKAGEKTATCAVTVTAEVTSISLNRTNLTIAKGSSEKLVATVEPSDATDKNVFWSSSDSEVASVDSNGLVKALRGGECVITAKAGNKTANCVVTVTAEVTSISLNKTSLTMAKGSSDILVATVEPSDASDKSVTWSSSDSSVASVDKDGFVAAHNDGNCTISANAGNRTANCYVNVKTEITSIRLNANSVQLFKGEQFTLLARVEPEDASDKSVVWSSSDSTVASVDQNGQVTAIGGGTCRIYAKSGACEAYCTIDVKVYITQITLNKTSITLLKGQSEELIVSYSPEDATEKELVWNSLDSSIATIDSNGVVTAVSPGNTSMTVKAKKSNVTTLVSFSVTVRSSAGNEDFNEGGEGQWN